MKISTIALAGLLTGSAWAKETRTFAVLRFNGKEMTSGRVDPMVSPGKIASHSHSIMGASNFGLTIDPNNLSQSKCTNAKIGGDFSLYWFPQLYFHDKDKNTFERVEMFYTNVYYFFEATDDKIKAFPKGLNIFAGNAMKTTPPATGANQLDSGAGEIQPVQWTCPRSNYDVPSYPADSDGATAGIQDPNNKGAGAGFPFAECDGYASPLRADIHMPSCYNPQAALDDYKNNMAYPSTKGAVHGANCPEGWIHVPHLFFEIYWNTPLFKDRWTPDGKSQPFVLANGDATGYSLHADFVSGWDEDVLQTIIDTCDAGSIGMDKCPQLPKGLNEWNDCTIPSPVDENIEGVLTALPGSNPLKGWAYGSAADPPAPVADSPAPVADSPAPVADSPAPVADAPAPSAVPAVGEDKEEEKGKEEDKEEDTYDNEKPAVATATTSEPEEPSVAPAAVPEPTTPAAVADDDAGCATSVQTVWETVTVTATPSSAPGANATTTAGGFRYAGCFRDTRSHVLAGSELPDLGPVTNDKCVAHCRAAGFALAGTEYGAECFCGNELVGSSKIDDAECAMECRGDRSTLCGGKLSLSVYSADGEAPIKTGGAARVRRDVHRHDHNLAHLARHRSHRY